MKLLLNRQLPEGGWNYGNTLVFGRMLRTHVQPTGLALAALAHETGTSENVHRSLNLLDHLLSKSTTTASLCYALMGLAAHGVRPQRADDWLSAAFQRNLTRDNPPYHLALLVLAATKAELYAPPDGLPR